MDYYSTLGVSQNATPDEIKKAYRKQAMKHHPDRNNGDDTKFKQVQSAYDVLSDPQKRQMVDMGADPNQQHQGGGYNRGPFEFHFGGGPEDIFQHFGFGFQQPNRQPKNKTFNVNVAITLEDVLTGKDISAEISGPNGRPKMVNIKIPQGIEHGQSIRYEGMGDASIPNARPGDLIVNVQILKNQIFQRQGDDLIVEKRVSIWEALLGSKTPVNTLDKKHLNITIPSGTQPDTVLSCRGEGLPNVRSGRRGNLLIKIKVDIPRNLSDKQLEHIKNARDGV